MQSDRKLGEAVWATLKTGISGQGRRGGARKTFGIILEDNSVRQLPPQAPKALGPGLTEAAVDDAKAAAKGTHKGRGQVKAVLGFQDASRVWRLRELLIKEPWVRCYGQRQRGFLHGSREDGHRTEG